VRLRVIITLTAPMIMKIVHGNLLNALSQCVERINLNLPKTPDKVWTEPSMVEVFLRYYHQKACERVFFEKVELDPCLKTRLPLWQDMTGVSCAYQRVLTIMPDGLMKICPYTRAGFLLHKPSEIKTMLSQAETLQRKIEPQCFLPLLEMEPPGASPRVSDIMPQAPLLYPCCKRQGINRRKGMQGKEMASCA
jgi:hypothetical protein